MLADIFIILFLIVLTGIFTGAELAVLSVNKLKVRRRAEDGDKKAALIKNVLDNTDTFLPTIAISSTVLSLLSGTYSGLVFYEPVSGWILSIVDTLPSAAVESMVVVIITIVLSYFSIIFADTIPKKIALEYSEKIAYFMIKPLVFYCRILSPFAFVFSKSSFFVMKVLRIKQNTNAEFATEEDIQLMVDAGGDLGNIDVGEQQMIKNIFAFDDKTAEEVATHRTDIVSLDIKDDYEELVKILYENHSRIPVYRENIDDIIGVLHIKDLMHHMIDTPKEDVNIMPLLRKPYFVPSSKKINLLFEEMKKNKIHFSIIIDEYGGTQGIVTMEDLIEEVMGSIFDEHDVDELPEIEKISLSSYIVSGTTHVEQVNEKLGIDLPTDEYDTIGGFVIGQIGRIPTNDEDLEIEYAGVVFQIRGVYEKRIQQLIVKKPLSEEEYDEYKHPIKHQRA